MDDRRCSNQAGRNLRRGFSLIEAIVVIAMIGFVIAMLIPAVQAAREAARRTQCTNNLRQLGRALHTYHSTNRAFPSGARSHREDGSWVWGHSWSVAVLPFLEHQAVYQQLDLHEKHSPHSGLIYKNGAVQFNSHNGEVLRGMVIRQLRCPSSPLEPFALKNTIVPGVQGALSPTYVAITGAVDHVSSVDKDLHTDQYRARGIQSRGGVLLPNGFTSIHQITDGTTHTLLVGEQSDWCYDPFGRKFDCRSDYGHSFTLGTTPDANPDDRWFNTTTIRYPVNHKAWNSTGVGDKYYGCNRPVQSTHPGGALLLFADGSVHFLREQLRLQTLFHLANRNDATPIQLDEITGP